MFSTSCLQSEHYSFVLFVLLAPFLSITKFSLQVMFNDINVIIVRMFSCINHILVRGILKEEDH